MTLKCSDSNFTQYSGTITTPTLFGQRISNMPYGIFCSRQILIFNEYRNDFISKNPDRLIQASRLTLKRKVFSPKPARVSSINRSSLNFILNPNLLQRSTMCVGRVFVCTQYNLFALGIEFKSRKAMFVGNLFCICGRL